MYACLAVTCHLHFWQNDWDFLRATVVTRGWNGYRNKSQHRKSTLEKKILPPFQQGFEPATFQSRVRCSNHWAIPAPRRRQNTQCGLYISLTAWNRVLGNKWRRVQARSRERRWCWTPKLAQKRSRAGRWSWAWELAFFCFSCFPTAELRTLFLFCIAVGTAVAWCGGRCAMPDGHCLYILLFWRLSTAALVFRVGARFEVSLFCPPFPRPYSPTRTFSNKVSLSQSRV